MFEKRKDHVHVAISGIHRFDWTPAGGLVQVSEFATETQARVGGRMQPVPRNLTTEEAKHVSEVCQKVWDESDPMLAVHLKPDPL